METTACYIPNNSLHLILQILAIKMLSNNYILLSGRRNNLLHSEQCVYAGKRTAKRIETVRRNLHLHLITHYRILSAGETDRRMLMHISLSKRDCPVVLGTLGPRVLKTYPLRRHRWGNGNGICV